MDHQFTLCSCCWPRVSELRAVSCVCVCAFADLWSVSRASCAHLLVGRHFKAEYPRHGIQVDTERSKEVVTYYKEQFIFQSCYSFTDHALVLMLNHNERIQSTCSIINPHTFWTETHHWLNLHVIQGVRCPGDVLQWAEFKADINVEIQNFGVWGKNTFMFQLLDGISTWLKNWRTPADSLIIRIYL